MTFRLLLYLIILSLGAFIGFKGKFSERMNHKIHLFQTLCLFFLLLIMGIRIGVDPHVLSSFFNLGYKAIVLSSFSVVFSILLLWGARKCMRRSNKEEVHSHEL